MATIDLIVLGILKKKSLSAYDIPETSKAVMHQQFLLLQALEKWIASVKSPN